MEHLQRSYETKINKKSALLTILLLMSSEINSEASKIKTDSASNFNQDISILTTPVAGNVNFVLAENKDQSLAPIIDLKNRANEILPSTPDKESKMTDIVDETIRISDGNIDKVIFVSNGFELVTGANQLLSKYLLVYGIKSIYEGRMIFNAMPRDFDSDSSEIISILYIQGEKLAETEDDKKEMRRWTTKKKEQCPYCEE